MKTYQFTYILVGKGETEDEALADALECFEQDIGDPFDTQLLENDETDADAPTS